MPTVFFEAVLGNLAVAAAAAVVAFAAGRWADRPALAHALWLLVLLKLITPPLVTVPVRCLPAKAEPTTVVPSPPTAPAPGVPSPVVIVEPAATGTAARLAPSASPPAAGLPSAPVARSATAPAAPRRWVPSWEAVVLGAWALGTVISLGLVVRRGQRFGRLLQFAAAAPPALAEEVAAAAARLGVRRVPRVRVVPGGIAPLLWAVGRPTVYFPAGLLARLSSDQRVALAAHELAHLRRWDHMVRVAEAVAMAAYWWCPLAWLARHELRRYEEEACDAEVTAALPGSGYGYASAILETIDYLAGVAPTPEFASGIGDATTLRRRLMRILGPTRPPAVSGRTRLAVAAVGLGLLAVGLKADRLTAALGVTGGENAPASPERPRFLRNRVAVSEPSGEPIHYLPTPVPLLPPAGAPVLAAALSPGGSRLAVATGNTVAVWDLRSKRMVFTLTGHTDAVNAVAFSPDGTRIATASNDTTARVWDATDGRLLHPLHGHGRWVRATAFSPDGRTLVTGGYDRTVRLWDATTGEPKAAWVGHAGGVRAVAVSPDGRTVASGGADNEARLWDVATGTTTRVIKKHEAAVRVVAFSPDGTRLATGSEDRTVRVWNPADGREVGSVRLPGDIAALGFSPRGSALFAGTLGGHVLSVNPATGLARGYVGVEPGRPAGSPALAAGVIAVAPSPDGRSLATVSQDGAAQAWPSAGQPEAPRAAFRDGHPVTAVALSPDGRTLATAGVEGAIHLWDAATARELMSFPGHPKGVTALVFGAGGRLVSTGADERVRVWDTGSGRATYTVIQPTADLCIAISPDGRTLAVGGRKMQGIVLVDLTTGVKPRRLGAWGGEVTAVAFTPAGDRIATGYADGLIRLWDVDRKEEVARGAAGFGSVDGIAFNPAGTTAAVVVNGAPRTEGEAESGPTHEVVFLGTRDGSVLDRPRPLPHPGPITAAAFTPEGAVLTAAHDGNLYLWNPATGRVARTIRGHLDAVRGVAVAPDGTAVFSAGDRAAKKWPMTAGQRPEDRAQRPENRR